MANDLNVFMCIGRLGQEPTNRFAKSGMQITSFSVAVGRQEKDKSTGEKVDATEWINCVVFDKQAEIASQYLHKGSQVHITGELRNEKYEKDGETKYITKVYVNRFQMLGSKQDNGSQGQQSKASKPAAKTGSGFDDMDDDIPF